MRLTPGSLLRKRAPEPLREAYVAVRMGNPIYYRVSAEGVEEIEESALPEGAAVAIFDEFDVRALTPKAASRAMASRLITRASGERLWIVNRSRDLGAVYGRAPARVLEIGRPVIPGAQLLDIAAVSRGIVRRNAVVGFDLGAAPRLSILGGYRADGELCPPQFAADPHDVDLFVAEYARINGLTPEGPATLAGAEELLRAMAQAKGYPVEEDILGVPRSRAYAAASGAGFALAAAALAWAGAQWSAAMSAARQADMAQAEARRLDAEVARQAEKAVEGLARAASLDIDRLLAAASAAWSPGARVSVRADGSGAVFSVRIAAQLGAAPWAQEAADPDKVRHAIERETAPDLARSAIAVERSANGFVVEYRTQNPLGPLGASARE